MRINLQKRGEIKGKKERLENLLGQIWAKGNVLRGGAVILPSGIVTFFHLLLNWIGRTPDAILSPTICYPAALLAQAYMLGMTGAKPFGAH